MVGSVERRSPGTTHVSNNVDMIVWSILNRIEHFNAFGADAYLEDFAQRLDALVWSVGRCLS